MKVKGNTLNNVIMAMQVIKCEWNQTQYELTSSIVLNIFS